MKGKRVVNLQDIYCENPINVNKRIRKEKVKLWMGNPKGLLEVLWDNGFLDTSKDVCTYYTLHR